ncbi:MAG: glycosyltransferase family 2 protein [Spirochaetes bacterium]|nr:glycosyltransferase family 2 protein [Spirochaetota bacterium]
MPLISVIIPTYNRARFVSLAIQSVLEQTFEDLELIVIDDGSTDETKDVVNRIRDKRLQYHYQFNRGPASARNNGLKQVSGSYIAFLDSDDKWVPEKLEIQLHTMKKNNDYLLSHTEETWYKGRRLIKPKKIHRKGWGDLFKQSLKLCSISMSTVILKRELIDTVGLFDEALEVCEDYDYWLRVTPVYAVLLIRDALTIKQGGHYDQQSQKYKGLDKYRIYALEKMINSHVLKEEQLQLALEELGKKCRIYGKGCIKYDKEEEGEFYLRLPEKYRDLIKDR